MTNAKPKRFSEVGGVELVPTRWYSNDWVKEHLPSEIDSNKVAIVTGSNSGTGFWCAKRAWLGQERQ
jgi:hypothetical protein